MRKYKISLIIVVCLVLIGFSGIANGLYNRLLYLQQYNTELVKVEDFGFNARFSDLGNFNQSQNTFFDRIITESSIIIHRNQQFNYFESIKCVSVRKNKYKEFKAFAKEIERNNPNGVSKLIEKGKNIEVLDKFGRTPLLYALELNRCEIAQLLIESGANLKKRDNFGDGALHYAIKYCESNDIIYKLVNKGIDIDQKNMEGYSPFLFSVLYKCQEVSFFLIEKGADYTLHTESWENAVHLAIRSGCDSILRFLITKDIDLEMESRYMKNTPLKLAIKMQRESMVNDLINAGAQIKMSYLHDAAWNNSRVVVERLLADGLTNPMDCDKPEKCFVTGFIYLASAGLADDKEKLLLYKNALSIYKLTKEKYKNELGEIRAVNTAMMTAIILGALLGAYAGSSYSQPAYVPDDGNSKAEMKYKKYLKIQISLCNERIKEIKGLISNINDQY